MVIRRLTLAGVGLVLAALAAGCSSAKGAGAGAGAGTGSGSATGPGATALVGTFKLAAGACHGGKATGSYFRMIQPGGTIAKGKFFANPDSRCSDKTYTLLAPGSAGGFTTGSYQPNPKPAFDRKGNGLAAAITRPEAFTAIKFALSTNPTDPQTKKSVPAPSITDTGGTLSGKLQAWSAQWNNQYFNLGSPKADGSTPGLTSPVTGTYNASTKAFTLIWASQVVGGPFNGFTGYWHLEGTFSPSS